MAIAQSLFLLDVIRISVCRNKQRSSSTTVNPVTVQNHAQERHISIYFPPINSDTNELLKEFFTVSSCSLFHFPLLSLPFIHIPASIFFWQVFDFYGALLLLDSRIKNCSFCFGRSRFDNMKCVIITTRRAENQRPAPSHSCVKIKINFD